MQAIFVNYFSAGPFNDNGPMRLVSLELRNFQAHSKTTIEFAPGITTIQGHTDIGKSAVLRALRWACLNDLAGDSFVREGEKKATVTLKVDSGESITRSKSVATVGLNTYHLGEKEFKAFGNGVPADIEALLKLNEINFQGQHDSPFWFNETAGEVSKKLNAVIELSVIDSALGYSAGQVRNAQERLTVAQEQVVESKKELADLAPQEERIEEFQEIKGRHETLVRATNAHCQLDGLLGKIAAAKKNLHQLSSYSSEGGKVLELARTARQADRDRVQLNLLLGSVRGQQDALSHTPPPFGPLAALYQARKIAQGAVTGLTAALRAVTSQSKRVDTLAHVADELERSFHKKIQGHKCPLCEKKV